MVVIVLKSEEILNYLTAFRVFVVEKLRMKLDPVHPPTLLLHRLDLAGFV